MFRAPRIPMSQERMLECMLIAVCLGLAVLLHLVVGYKMVVLNLFYLPVVLAAFFLGRTRAGTLALFCVLVATVVAVLDLPAFSAGMTPLVTGLSLTVWAAVMGLNAIIVGTLSNERSSRLSDLHDAYLGVVEVLSRYLRSADTQMKDRSSRVATLCQSVARQLRLSDQEIDDIRVAVLLNDINHVEVTAQVIHRAFGDLGQQDQYSDQPHTFRGSELVQSLGSVLTGALPLILSQPGASDDFSRNGEHSETIPFGAAIIHAVHRFDTLVYDQHEPMTASEALNLLNSEFDGEYHPAVLHALGEILLDLPASSAERLDVIEELLQLEK